MITVFLALSVGAGVFAAAYFPGDWGMGWSVTVGIVGFLASMASASFLIQRRVKRDMDAVQAILADGQHRLKQKMARWQMRPPGSIQAAQKEIADDTRVFVREALARTEALRRYRLWVPMMDRQIASAQLQLSWMIKDFKAVDAAMPKAMFIDPAMCAIKMARLYMQERPTDEILKVYRKAVARARYNGNVLPAAAMSWIQVKRGDVDGAFKTLTEALKKSDDATLKQNRELLMNNRVGHFSNSGIGDQWYSLLLEEPKVRAQRQHFVRR